MILWFSGISGAGKTSMANFFKRTFKKKIIHLDGDEFRKLFSNDLKYSLKDRDRNAKRLTLFVKYLSEQNLNVIVSANLTSQKYRTWCKKNLRNYVHVFIDANISSLLKRDYKKLYKNALKSKIKNVVGIDVKFSKPRNYDMIITNNSSKISFFKNSKKINSFIKKKKIKIF